MSFFRLLESALPRPLKVLAIRFDKSPITTVDDLGVFVRTRSSYVAQTSLYGYLKTRMGTSYRSLFEDDRFSYEVRLAAARLFGSCLGDFSIYVAAICHSGGSLNAMQAKGLTIRLARTGMKDGLQTFPNPRIEADAMKRLDQRLCVIDWQRATDADLTFAGSEGDLVRFAPVSDEFKDYDREIVMNSIRFRWRDAREQLHRRVDTAAVSQSWKAEGQTPLRPGKARGARRQSSID